MRGRSKTEIVQFHLNEVGAVDDFEIQQLKDFIKEKKHEINNLQTHSKEILSSSHLDVNTQFLGQIQEFSAEINHYLEQCKKHPKLFQKEITALEAYVHSTNELLEEHQERLQIEVKIRDQTQFQLAKLKIKSKEPSNLMDSKLIKLFTDKAPLLVMEPKTITYMFSEFESLESKDSKVLDDHNQLLNAFYIKFTRADPDRKVQLMNEKTFHDLKHAVGLTRAYNEKKLKEIDHITNRRDKKDKEIYTFLYPLVPYDLLSDKAKVSKSFHEVVQGYIEAYQKHSTITFDEKLKGGKPRIESKPDQEGALRALVGSSLALKGGLVEFQDQLEKRVQQRQFYKFRRNLGMVIENNLVVDYKQPPKSPTSPASPLIPSEPTTPTSPGSFTSQPKFELPHHIEPVH